jgi:hypothetical protein
MSKPTTNWDAAESWKRLVAAMLAAGIKVSPLPTASSALANETIQARYHGDGSLLRYYTRCN